MTEEVDKKVADLEDKILQLSRMIERNNYEIR